MELVGHSLSYQIAFSNTGGGLATDVWISDTLPVNLLDSVITYSGITATQVSTTPLIFEVADLPAGAGGVITITGRTPENFHGWLFNAVEIDNSGETLASQGNNRAELLLQILHNIVFPFITR
jgi:uncharacterized repeat protein (TIGR01451 family)